MSCWSCSEKRVLGRPEFLRLRGLEDEANICAVLDDDDQCMLDVVDLLDENPIFHVPEMHNNAAFRFNALEDGMNGEGEHEGNFSLLTTGYTARSEKSKAFHPVAESAYCVFFALVASRRRRAGMADPSRRKSLLTIRRWARAQRFF